MGAGPALHRLMDEYKGKVRLVIKMHPYKYRDFAHIAAEAAFSAHEQGMFWRMHLKMIENSPKLDRLSLIKYAGEIGLDVDKFTRDLDGMRHMKIIERDKKLANELDLYNTPAFFFNGRKVFGNRSYEYFKAVFEEELDAASKKK